MLVAGAGLLGDAMNALAGGGSFVTLPALIVVGVPSVQANASSTVALFPGGVQRVGLPRRTRSSRSCIARSLLLTTLADGVGGGVSLLAIPVKTFDCSFEHIYRTVDNPATRYDKVGTVYICVGVQLGLSNQRVSDQSQLLDRQMSRSTQLTIALVTVIGFTASPCVARGQNATCAHQASLPTDSAALALEKEWATAATSHDTAALGCILAGNFVDTNWRGLLRTRRDVLNELPATPSGLMQHYSEWRLVRYDSTAIVRGLNTITDAGHRTVAILRFTDVLQFSDGRWRAVAAQETPVQQNEPDAVADASLGGTLAVPFSERYPKDPWGHHRC